MRTITMLVLLLLAPIAAAEPLCLEDSYGSRWDLQATGGIVTGLWQPGEGMGAALEPVPLLGTVTGTPARTVISVTGVGQAPAEGWPIGVVGIVAVRIVVTAEDTWLDVTTPGLAWGATMAACDGGYSQSGTQDAPPIGDPVSLGAVRLPESWFELGEREREEGRR